MDSPGTFMVNQYLMLRVLGAGSYGKVVQVKNLDDMRDYACKVISKSRLRRQLRLRNMCRPPSPDLDETDVKREIAVLKKISAHPNITSLVEVLDDTMEDSLYLVLELCAGPIMTLHFGERCQPYPEETCRKYFRDIALGLEYLHSQNIIHCDIKPENILLTHDNRAQISDFGVSRMVADECDLIMALTASPAFCPPEACKDCGSDMVNGKALDVWCLGVTLFCISHGYAPFEDEHVLDLFKKIGESDPPFADSLSGELKGLLTGMLTKAPSDRMRMSMIKEDPWVTRNGDNPMMATEQNCVFLGVTNEEVENAVVKGGLIGRLFSKIRTTTDRLRWPTSSSSAETTPVVPEEPCDSDTPLSKSAPVDSAWSINFITRFSSDR